MDGVMELMTTSRLWCGVVCRWLTFDESEMSNVAEADASGKSVGGESVTEESTTSTTSESRPHKDSI